MGGKLGRVFARAGHEVVFSYSHSERKLKRLAREAGERAWAGTAREAVADAPLLAVHWSRVNGSKATATNDQPPVRQIKAAPSSRP
jgi:predicted dinucleotide-binding enzyme